MGTPHNVKLAGTKLGRALVEIAEDRVADVLRHYQDAGASGKASKVKLEITITPTNDQREQFNFAVSGGTALSARKTFETNLYAGVNQEDEVEVVEFNPRQLRIPGTATHDYAGDAAEAKEPGA